MPHGPGPLMCAVFETLRESSVPVVLAPTGYGKTMASPWIAEEAARHGLAAGLIHVVPMRSLVRRIFLDVFSKYPGSGYQMSTPTSTRDKSPYLMRRLVVSTIDSYLWNLYRVPVLEYTKIARGVSSGHYYPVASAILSSVNVLDEAHIYLSEISSPNARHQPYHLGASAVYAALGYLSWTRTPTIVETATMHPQTILDLVKPANTYNWGLHSRVIVWDCLAGKLSSMGLPPSALRVVPRRVDPWVSDARWETRLYKHGWDEGLLREIARMSLNGPVLVVANTIKRAVKIYRELSGSASTDVVLVHGRLSENDRLRAEDSIRKIEAKGSGIIVATQVIEVGVDVNSIAVYTDPAPAENLVQRAGRACRRGASLEWCKSESGLVTIVLDVQDPNQHAGDGIYDQTMIAAALRSLAENLSSGRNVDWRDPCTSTGVPYYDLIMSQNRPRLAPFARNLSNILKKYLRQDGTPTALLRVLDNLGVCSLFRNTLMIPVYTGYGFVQVDLDWALSGGGRRYLENCGDKMVPCILAIQNGVPCGRAPATDLIRATRSGAGRCSSIVRAIRKDLSKAAKGCPEGPITYALEARQGAYKRGIGLV